MGHKDKLPFFFTFRKVLKKLYNMLDTLLYNNYVFNDIYQTVSIQSIFKIGETKPWFGRLGTFLHSFSFVFGPHPAVLRAYFLILHSGITTGRLGRPYRVPGIEAEPFKCKANTLPSICSCSSPHFIFNLKYFQLICNSEMQEVSITGLYLSMPLLNHRCDPNCLIVFNWPYLLLNAIQDIQAGKKLIICYLDMLMTSEELQKQLRNQYLLWVTVPTAKPRPKMLIC